MDNNVSIKGIELDALKEIGNIGSGNAAVALSKILNKKILMDVPDTAFIPITQFSHYFGGPDKIVMSIYSPILGDLSGETLFIFSRECALGLVDLMMGNAPGKTKILDELSESAFKEMANIYIGSYLNAVADLTDIRILPGIPVVATDMVQAIIDSILMKMGEFADKVLVNKATISVDCHNIDGHFIFFFDLKSMETLIRKINEHYAELLK